MFENIKADTNRYLSTYGNIGKFRRIFYLLSTQEYYAVAVYRFGRCVVTRIHIPIISWVLRFIYFILNKFTSIISGVEIWVNSDIGEGLHIAHYGGIYILARIGKNCTIAQQVVIGYKGAGQGGEVPIIGDNVYIGSGAKIIGKVKIGNNVRIGANAVVVEDVPDNATVVGVPAKIVKIR